MDGVRSTWKQGSEAPGEGEGTTWDGHEDPRLRESGEGPARASPEADPRVRVDPSSPTPVLLLTEDRDGTTHTPDLGGATDPTDRVGQAA